MIKILLADDHVIVRDGVKAVLERKGKDLEVVGEVGNGQELVTWAETNDADVYVVDISMPVLNGVEATQRLIKAKPEAKVIMLSMYDDRIAVEKSLKAGAKGFIVKVSTADEIVEAIHEVAAGRFYLCSKVSKYIVQIFNSSSIFFILYFNSSILSLIAYFSSSSFAKPEVLLAIKDALDTDRLCLYGSSKLS